ncbi:STAS domain-containing protein [bacterium]|nr:STAS domain-containing protein [bacterium]
MRYNERNVSQDNGVNPMHDTITVAINDDRMTQDTTIGSVYERIFGLIKEHSYINLIIDFAKVNYLSSSVLSKLISLHKKLKEKHGILCLCNINPVVLKIFELTQLDTYLNIFPDEDKAQVFLKKF